MGARFTHFFYSFWIEKPDYDPNDPLDRMRIDMWHAQMKMCQRHKGRHLPHLCWEFYALFWGSIFASLTPARWSFYQRMAPLSLSMQLAVYYDGYNIIEECKDEELICDQVIQAHKFMVAMGHPPYTPMLHQFRDKRTDRDRWAQLRKPPLILRRELIQNWKLQSVQLPMADYDPDKELRKWINKEDKNKRKLFDWKYYQLNKERQAVYSSKMGPTEAELEKFNKVDQ